MGIATTITCKFNEKFQDLPVKIQKEVGESTWFGFSIILEGKLINRRDELVKVLNSNQIECRPIVAGNFMLNPVIKNHNIKYISNGNYENTNNIHNNGIFFGNDSKDLKETIDLLYTVIRNMAVENS